MSDHRSAEPAVAITGESRRSVDTDSGGEPRRATVPIDAVAPGENPRLNGVDPEHVHVLAKLESDLPPILVERATMRIIDGRHRLRAAIARGQQTIEVEFFDGPEQAAFVRAVEANIAHGLPLSLADRRAAAEQMIRLYPGWSDRRVAESAGLSDKTVAAIRRSSTPDGPQLSARVGRDGRTRPLNGTVGRWIASELIDERPHATLREIAKEAGISLATVRDVRERMRRGEDPIPMRRSSMERHNGGGPQQNAGSSGLSGSSATGAATRQLPDRQQETSLDCGPLLEGLKRDPALRHSEAGRALLRWLDFRTVKLKELQDATARIPPHAAIIVAKVARRCSAAWEDLATKFESREHDADAR